MCGHSLMASCPPAVKVETDIPFGHGPRQNPEAQKTWDLSKTDLANLLDLSKRLDLDGEITPVMAWGMILAHPRFSELRPEHFTKMSQELVNKIRCYGYVFTVLGVGYFLLTTLLDSVPYWKNSRFEMPWRVFFTASQMCL